MRGGGGYFEWRRGLVCVEEGATVLGERATVHGGGGYCAASVRGGGGQCAWRRGLLSLRRGQVAWRRGLLCVEEGATVLEERANVRRVCVEEGATVRGEGG
eukprot:CAMPEP_0181321946 /NCGR_PEP_ID=MMETSP1101-20121128/18967_1 /TAXON_ID=46948 /ORGANISM="Rhodomonas abbreviata, Strain Caron Lab Isolate" /LENGTH=100 /DNA_ID=CAMNT_0023429829 /DNA_START=506 /DNA_END=808 /DNA_ORIENTATION=+